MSFSDGCAHISTDGLFVLVVSHKQKKGGAIPWLDRTAINPRARWLGRSCLLSVYPGELKTLKNSTLPLRRCLCLNTIRAGFPNQAAW